MKEHLAVVVEELGLVRAGMARVLASVGVAAAAETRDGRDAVRLAAAHRAGLLIVGHQAELPVERLVRDAKSLPSAPRVMVLVGRADSEVLTVLAGAGADALVPRSAEQIEVADAVARVLKGERVLAPALVPAFMGMVATANQPGPPAAVGEEAAVQVLSAREREVLGRLAQGLSNQEIACALFLSQATVKTHLNRVYAKLGARNRNEAVARAVSLGLLG